MSKNTTIKPLAVAMGAAFATTLAASPVANAADNPFAMTELPGGYMVADSHAAEGKCGEGMKKDMEGKCGEGMKQGMDEGMKKGMDEGMKKGMEGKCGEGKCGEGMMKKEAE
jgi:uncharacterized low-complexity protein